MRYTLLQLTQSILSSIGGDEINSISDTTEALDVVDVIKQCYYDIVGEIQPEETRGLFHLDASGDDLKPCLMTMPSHAAQLDLLKYNTDASLTNTDFREIQYVSPNDFMDLMNSLDETQTWVNSSVVVIHGQNFNIKYRNDQAPTFYTSFDDRTIVFDSYDSTIETTLTSVRTYCLGQIIPVFQATNSYIPDLDARQFQLLLQSSKAQAWVEIRQTVNEKAERKERRNRLLAQKSTSQTDNRSELRKHTERYGMGRRGSGSSILNGRTRNGS